MWMAYRNAGPSAQLIIPALVLNFITFWGLLFNGAVVYITVKTASLRSTTNWH